MSGSNSASTASARSAKGAAGKTRKPDPAWLVRAEALWKSKDDVVINAIDAMALAVYEASWHGQVVPPPDRMVYELLRLGWMISPIPEEVK